MGSHTRIGRHAWTEQAEASAISSRDGFTPTPLLVQWMATLRCDLACPHCLAAGGDSRMQDMPLDTVLDLIDQLAEMHVREFLITGGEPLVRDDLPEIIDYLGRRGVSYSINTARTPRNRRSRR